MFQLDQNIWQISGIVLYSATVNSSVNPSSLYNNGTSIRAHYQVEYG